MPLQIRSVSENQTTLQLKLMYKISLADQGKLMPLSATLQSLRFALSCLRFLKKPYNLDIQSDSQSFQHRNCRIFQASLDSADIGPINLCVYRQCLLRQPATDSEFPEISGDQRPGVHSPTVTRRDLTNHGL